MSEYPFEPRKLARHEMGRGVQWRWTVTCPICGHDYNHLENVNTEDAKDNYEASWEGRGDLTVLTFSCEGCGDKWALCFGFHKGNTYIFYRSVEQS